MCADLLSNGYLRRTAPICGLNVLLNEAVAAHDESTDNNAAKYKKARWLRHSSNERCYGHIGVGFVYQELDGDGRAGCTGGQRREWAARHLDLKEAVVAEPTCV